MKSHSLYEKYARARGLLVAAAFLAICIVVNSAWSNAEEKMSMKLTSPAFVHGEGIPLKFTCEGADMSPPLQWEGVPDNARSLVLIVDDPDAPDPGAPRMTWVHWVLYNMPPDATGLSEGVESDRLPAGTGEGLNDWKKTGYRGPCPPIGRHRYFFRLYALDTVLKNIGKPTRSQVEAAMRGHIITRTELLGTYMKAK